MEDFDRRKGGARKLLTKEKTGLFLDQDLFRGKGTAIVFNHADYLFFP